MTSERPQENSQDRSSESRQRRPRSRGEGFAQILHDRARRSAEQLNKLLVSLSTAILAVYFLALTTGIEPELTNWQTIICIAGLVPMGIATVAGILGLLCDAKRNYLRATALQTEEQEKRDQLFAVRERWLNYERWCDRSLSIFFVIGVIASVVYLVLRVMGW